MRSIPSLGSFPNVAFETVPMLACASNATSLFPLFSLERESPRTSARFHCVSSQCLTLPLNCRLQGTWAGLHDNVPDRPSAKVAPAGCQLATVALIKTKTVVIPQKVGCTAEVVTQYHLVSPHQTLGARQRPTPRAGRLQSPTPPD